MPILNSRISRLPLSMGPRHRLYSPRCLCPHQRPASFCKLRRHTQRTAGIRLSNINIRSAVESRRGSRGAAFLATIESSWHSSSIEDLRHAGLIAEASRSLIRAAASSWHRQTPSSFCDQVSFEQRHTRRRECRKRQCSDKSAHLQSIDRIKINRERN